MTFSPTFVELVKGSFNIELMIVMQMDNNSRNLTRLDNLIKATELVWDIEDKLGNVDYDFDERADDDLTYAKLLFIALRNHKHIAGCLINEFKSPELSDNFNSLLEELNSVIAAFLMTDTLSRCHYLNHAMCMLNRQLEKIESLNPINPTTAIHLKSIVNQLTNMLTLGNSTDVRHLIHKPFAEGLVEHCKRLGINKGEAITKFMNNRTNNEAEFIATNISLLLEMEKGF